MDPNSAFDNVDSGNLGLFPSVLRNGQENGVDAFRSQDSYGMPQKADGSSILSDRGNAVQKIPNLTQEKKRIRKSPKISWI